MPASPARPEPGRDERAARLAASSRKGWPLLAIVILLPRGRRRDRGPTIAPKDPNRQNIIVRLQPPMADRAGGVQFLLGTDALGRDVLSRLLYGARVSLLVGSPPSLIGGTLGTVLGMVAGLLRRPRRRDHHAPRPTSSSRSPSSCWRSCSWSCWGRACSTSSSSSASASG
jgi:ABC-type dipeptide/oligopeptide/nickel transport system permease subunit